MNIKRKLTPTFSWSFLFIFFFCGNVLAQQKFKPSLSLGVTSSQISGDGTSGFRQFGINGGLGIDYKLNDIWSINSGLFFNQKGSRRPQQLGDLSTYRLRVNYIDLPIGVSYKWREFIIASGLMVNTKINHNEFTEFGPVETTRSFKRFEFAAFLGSYYSFKENWGVGVEFQNSIIPVRPHEEDVLFPPTFLLGELHQKIYDLGQYFTTLSFKICLRIN